MARRSRGSPTRGSALELAAVKDQSDRDPEERSEKGRPDSEPPLLWDRTKEGDAAAAAERADKRDEAKRTDEGALAGSWDTNLRWGAQGGRAFTTSLALLTLEVYYRYLPLSSRGGGPKDGDPGP